MSRPVKETPILHGKDAIEFGERLRKAADNPIAVDDYLRAMELFRRVKIIDRLANDEEK